VNRVFVVVAVVVSSVAWAQQPTLTPHPIEVLTREVTPAQNETLQKEYRRLLSLSQVSMPARSVLTQALTDLKRQDCATSDECLRKLSVLGGTLYALHVSAVKDPNGSTTLTARVVRDDGKLVLGPLSQKEARKGTEAVDVTMVRALNGLLAAAKLGQLPPSREATVAVVTPPVEAPKVDAGVPVVVEKPVEAVDAGVAFTPPPPPPLEPSPLKTVGTVTMVAGGGLAVIGGVILGVGAGQAAGLEVIGGAVRSDQAQQAVSTNTLQGIGSTLLVAGGVAAAAGLVLRLVAPDEPVSKVSVSAAPVPGGAAVMIGGSL
jgi:hypothetical protein